MFIGKITQKGQITIPAKFRKKINTDIVQIEMVGDKIVIRPIKRPGGALKKYAIRNKSIEEIMRIEKEAMKHAFSEKHGDN